MQRLAERVLRPLAAPERPGRGIGGWRVMALDGSSMDVADEAANAEFFGYPTATRGESAFPQARLLGLVECGTHVVAAADIAPYGRSEKAMAAQLGAADQAHERHAAAGRPRLLQLQAVADRSRDRGGAVVARQVHHQACRRSRSSTDGSYLSTVYDSADGARRHGRRCG